MRVIDGEDEDDGEHNYLVNDENMRFLLNDRDWETK